MKKYIKSILFNDYNKDSKNILEKAKILIENIAKICKL